MLVTAVMVRGAPAAAQQQAKPNIVVIMGDDIGYWNIGAYHQGMMAGRTPNLDKIAAASFSARLPSSDLSRAFPPCRASTT